MIWERYYNYIGKYLYLPSFLYCTVPTVLYSTVLYKLHSKAEFQDICGKNIIMARKTWDFRCILASVCLPDYIPNDPIYQIYNTSESS